MRSVARVNTENHDRPGMLGIIPGVGEGPLTATRKRRERDTG